MGRYCVITRDNTEFVIIERKRLSYLDDNNEYTSVTSDVDVKKYNGCFFLNYGESTQCKITIVDTDGKFLLILKKLIFIFSTPFCNYLFYIYYFIKNIKIF